MSTQDQSKPGGGSAPRKAETPTCPTCERRMAVKQVSPVLFASELDDVVYGCARCGTETKRTVKRT